MKTCPCCSNTLLRHIRSHQIYWFCPHCWQEMPNLDAIVGLSPQYRYQLETLFKSTDKSLVEI
nr:hypothetical protein [Kovacikia minuta]